ncbi:MAG: hypothetical protein ACFFG0_19265 [Candidatus Thorarchaeota archaeon]
MSVRVPKSKRREYRTAIKNFVEKKFLTETITKNEGIKITTSKDQLDRFRKFEEFAKKVKDLDKEKERKS